MTSFPGSARERAVRQALPAVNEFIEGWESRQSLDRSAFPGKARE
jgi:hypothetical protein